MVRRVGEGLGNMCFGTSSVVPATIPGKDPEKSRWYPVVLQIYPLPAADPAPRCPAARCITRSRCPTRCRSRGNRHTSLDIDPKEPANMPLFVAFEWT